MSTIDDYILGNDLVHDRFCVTTEVVGKIVSSAPHSVTIQQLEELTGRPARALVRLCSRLSNAGLLQWDTEKHEAWRLACDPAATTMEDVFRCVLTEQLDLSKRMAPKPGEPGRPYHDVDLLIMQMTMSINQSVFKHLRQFTLERLRMNIRGMFPFTPQLLPDAHLHDATEQEATAGIG